LFFLVTAGYVLLGIFGDSHRLSISTSLGVARRLSEIFDGGTTRHLMLKGKLSNKQLITTDKPIGFFLIIKTKMLIFVFNLKFLLLFKD
jgi:hypothetical protein